MAKSKNAKLNDATVDLSGVDLSSSSPTPSLDFLRSKAEPKAEVSAPVAPTTDAAKLAQSLPVEDLGVAYEKTQTKILKSRPPRVTEERPIVNLNKKVIEGLPPSEVERLNEEPTNVPHTFSNGEYRNQLHGDYSHFAKATNLLSYLGEKVGAVQDVLANHPVHRDALDKINQMLSIAHGHVTDATAAHRRGESGMVRLHPVTGLASPIGRQFIPKFLKDGREDVAGAQAIEREMRVSDSSFKNPVEEINTRFGEPQLKSEGLKTQDLNESPNGAIPHFHRALEYATTAANLLQNTLADASSDKELSTSVQPWNGKYDDRPGNPDLVNHARELSDNYANSVAEAKPAPEMKEEEMPSAEARDLFDRTKKAREAEMQAKVHQAEIHHGLIMNAHRELFGADIAARQEEAARKTAEAQDIPVIPKARSINPYEDKELGARLAAAANDTDEEYSVKRAKAQVTNVDFLGSSGLVDSLHQIAKDAHAAGKIDSSSLEEINGHVETFNTQRSAANQLANSGLTFEEPARVYDPAKDPRFILSKIDQDRLSPAEKAQKRDEFLKNRGITLVQHQKEVRAFEDKLPVIRAMDADNRAKFIAAKTKAIIFHHDTISGFAKDAVESYNKIHSILSGAGLVQGTAPGQVAPDYTGIPTPQQFFRASTPERPATREEAISALTRETEEASRKAEEQEAARQADLAAREQRERSYTREAGQLGFYTADENLARGFIEAGEKNTVTEGMAAAGNPGVGGTRRVDFLTGLATKGAIDYSATPKTPRPGTAVFIAPGMAEATPAPVSPTERKRRARADARLTARAVNSTNRRLARQVNTLGVNLEDVTAPERPTRVRAGVSDAQLEVEENKAVVEGLKRSVSRPSSVADGIEAARTNLQNIQEFNATNAAESVGTTIKPTRRTRK
jgi:hypothetical protein